MAKKAYVRLADPGTTFYDMEQQKSVVADRVALVELTARVNQAIKDRQLDKLDKDQGEALYNAQEAKMRKDNPALANEVYGVKETSKEEAAVAKAATKVDESLEEDVEEEKTSAAASKKNASRK